MQALTDDEPVVTRGCSTPFAAARLVRRARPLERRGGHLRMRRIRCRDCVPRTGREPRAMSLLSGLNPAVVCTLPWHCDSANRAGDRGKAVARSRGRLRLDLGETRSGRNLLAVELQQARTAWCICTKLTRLRRQPGRDSCSPPQRSPSRPSSTLRTPPSSAHRRRRGGY